MISPESRRMQFKWNICMQIEQEAAQTANALGSPRISPTILSLDCVWTPRHPQIYIKRTSYSCVCVCVCVCVYRSPPTPHHFQKRTKLTPYLKMQGWVYRFSILGGCCLALRINANQPAVAQYNKPLPFQNGWRCWFWSVRIRDINQLVNKQRLR